MICLKCEKEIDNDSKFCEFCGNKTEISQNPETKSLLKNRRGLREIEELNKKMWYRLLKVIYLASLTLLIAFLIVLSFEEKPRKEFDGYNTLIHCKGGATYKAGENDIPFLKPTDFSIRNSLKQLCMSGKFPERESSQYHLSDLPKNYTLTYAYKDIGSWKSVFGASMISSVLVLIAFEISRRVFYYIYLGKLFPKKHKEGK
jgi:hypothetical protein